jgi:hypothetical protein
MTFYTIEMINDIKKRILQNRLTRLQSDVKYYKKKKLTQYIILQIQHLNKEINYIQLSLERIDRKKYVKVPGVNLQS